MFGNHLVLGSACGKCPTNAISPILWKRILRIRLLLKPMVWVPKLLPFYPEALSIFAVFKSSTISLSCEGHTRIPWTFKASLNLDSVPFILVYLDVYVRVSVSVSVFIDTHVHFFSPFWGKVLSSFLFCVGLFHGITVLFKEKNSWRNLDLALS